MLYFIEFMLFPAITVAISVLYVISLILTLKQKDNGRRRKLFAATSVALAVSAILVGLFLLFVTGVFGLMYSLPILGLGVWITVSSVIYFRAPENKSIVPTAVPSLIWCVLLMMLGALMVLLSFALRHM